MIGTPAKGIAALAAMVVRRKVRRATLIPCFIVNSFVNRVYIVKIKTNPVVDEILV
jgi:hypothetical protein